MNVWDYCCSNTEDYCSKNTEDYYSNNTEDCCSNNTEDYCGNNTEDYCYAAVVAAKGGVGVLLHCCGSGRMWSGSTATLLW